MGLCSKFTPAVLLLQLAALASLTASSSLQNGCLRGGGVDTSLHTHVQEEALEFQRDLTCHENETAIELFYEEIRVRNGLEGLQYYSPIPTFENTLESCRARSCGPGSEVIFCIHLYHPTEDIQICLDRNGVINETALSKLLQLQCYFSVAGPEVDCPYERDHCIAIRQPEHFLDKALLTCSVNNSENGCYDRSYNEIDIAATGGENNEPRPTFMNGTELVLGETNVFLCTVVFEENRFYSGLSAAWYIDDVIVPKLHEEPFCEENCLIDHRAGGRDERIRCYEQQHGSNICHNPIFNYHEWLWIDNATAEDALHTYTCRGSVTFLNPFQRRVHGELDVTFTPVLPLLEVDVIAVPYNMTTSLEDPLQLTFQEGEGFQWSISVTAGEGDQLQWLFNDEIIPSTNDSVGIEEEIQCPHNELGSLYAVSWPVDDLGGYARKYNSTLIACGISLENSTGIYRCRLNRSRDDPVGLWSAAISVPSTTMPGGNPVAKTPFLGHTDAVSIGVTAALLVIFVPMFVCLAICCHRRKRRRKRREVDISALNVLGIAHTPFNVEGMGRPMEKWEKLAKEESTLYFSDPWEFPRDKLFLTDTVLGTGSFGLVLQAKAEGIIKNSPGRNVVAIKTCRDNAPQHEYLDLWEELQLMKRMEPHENIVNLLGQCTKPPGPVYLIVEYAMHGNLREYLRQCKQAVERLNRKPLIARGSRRRRSQAPSLSSGLAMLEKIPLSQQSSVFSDISLTSCPSPVSGKPVRRLTQDSGIGGEAKCSVSSEGAPLPSEIAAISSEGPHDYINCKGLLYMEDVSNFAMQIACGLQHLKKLKVVHCDLAARNILIAEGFVLKIGDFGMAREMSESKTVQQKRIPLRWSAPEVIQDEIFTHQSDIWSYGVLLWEILTYGQIPYQEQKISISLDLFIQYLLDGNRLACPEGCPANVYDFMFNCWHLNPDVRPTADDLIKFLARDANDDDDIECVTGPDSVAPPTSQRPKETPV